MLLAVFYSSITVLLIEMSPVSVFSYSLPAILSYMVISFAMFWLTIYILTEMFTIAFIKKPASV